SASGVDSNGNIGLGTTTPQAKFVVTDGNIGIGTWRADNKLTLVQPVDTVFGGIGVSNSALTGTGYVWEDSNNRFNLSSGSTGAGGLLINSSTLTLDASGNIGLGTNTPQDALIVTNGNVG